MEIKNLIKKFIPPFFIDRYHFLMAFLGAILYQFPSRKLKVIGITGTNGKSTVVHLAAKILEEAGNEVAILSSICFKIGKKERQNTLRMTMPGRFQIQKFLRQAVNSGCQYAVLEVTSEGIKQYRHKFINFNAAVFTNLTPEHIEAHGGFENYKKAKGKLFQATKNIHIINLDDENAEYFLQFPAEKKYKYSIGREQFSTDCDSKKGISTIIKAENIQILSSGLKFSVNNARFNLKLLGEFNIYNALAAIGVGLSQGILLETCKMALEKIKGIPGRMEKVVSEPFKVFVDYAFTPNALESVYKTLSNPKSEIRNPKLPPLAESSTKSGQILNSKFQIPKMICVLGACGGGRDKWKRPVLGEIAARYCDEIIITNEDPYNENPSQIIKEVMQGVLKIKNHCLENESFLETGKSKIKNINVNVYDILDRREAINKALSSAGEGDVVIITGKGCEPSICIANGKRIPWDDRKVVKEEFEKIDAKKD